MAAQKVKGGYKVKLKGGGLGKRTFKTQAAAQAQSRGAGKKVAKRKTPARKAPAKKSPKRRTSVAKSNPNNNKSPKIGAAIQAFKGTQPLVAPVIDSVVRNGPNQAAVNSLGRKANLSYAGNVGVVAVNQAVDRKIAHGAALSRGSITAWAPEAFAAFQTINEVRGQDGKEAVLAANSKLAKTINGYDPVSGNMDLTDPDFRTYQTLKLVGGVARRISNTGPFKRIAKPMKKFLGEMGGAL